MSSVVLVAETSNERGDLLTRLARDYLAALGYSDFRLNVHRTGRELDIVGRHAVETKRFVRAECKAHAEQIGGADINKFVGALEAERLQIGQRTEGATVAGYFLSLSGFRDSALEQEADVGNQRVNLITGQQLVDTLIQGRVLVSREDAVASAARLLGPSDQTRVRVTELLAHPKVGLVWAIGFGTVRQPGAMVLVHADGDPLDKDSARTVAEAAASSTDLHGRLVVDSRPAPGDLSSVRAAYFRYVQAECGEIQLEGMPIDEQAVAGRIGLESLFVPMHVEPATSEVVPGLGDELNPAAGDSRLDLGTESRSRARKARAKIPTRIPLGDLLPTVKHLALLAAPGGGKSTLIKRLAVAYAFPNRRALSTDRLPDQEQFPIFVRCRELGSLVREPILKIAFTVPADRAGIAPSLRPAFEKVVLDALHSGRALLLIDGLDEIADDGDRIAFASALRVFTSVYAGVSLVLTAREAGFRAVAGTLAGSCERYRLAELDEADIGVLVRLWYEHVYRKDSEVADRVVETILASDRLRLLAGTPLLLTTLLLVNRWMGQLPTHKASLYEKAIEVLLRTWNVQAHEPIDLREALPRLEYVAFSMMQSGTQRISQTLLLDLLASAREEMPEVLAYSRLSDSDFIDRVELRSSLLMRSGHQVEGARLVPLFEFRHLTFQEYLAAKAIADGYFPGRSRKVTTSKIWHRYLLNPAWKETVGLTSSLVDHRTAQQIVESLTARASEPRPPNELQSPTSRRATQLLAECLINEVQIVPDVADRALRAVVESRDGGIDDNIVSLAGGRFGAALESIASSGLTELGERAPEHGSALGCVQLQRLGIDLRRPKLTEQRAEELERLLRSGDAGDQARGGLAMMILAFQIATKHMSDADAIFELGDRVVDNLSSSSASVRFVSAWAIAWLGSAGWTPTELVPVLTRLAWLADPLEHDHVRRQSAWAIGAIPIADRVDVGIEPSPDLSGLLKTLAAEPEHDRWVFQGRHVAATLGYYLRQPWSDAELVPMTEGAPQSSWLDENRSWEVRILERLGPDAKARLEQVRARDREPQLTLELATQPEDSE